MDTPQLVAQAQAGDEPARTELLRPTGQLVCARVGQVVHSTPHVEDVVQDVLLAVLAGLPHLTEPAAFLAWLRRVTDNILADHIAGRRRSPSDGAAATLDTPVQPGATILLIPKVEGGRA